MSDAQKLSEQAETKKTYVTPELTVYGSVEDLTRGTSAGTHTTDATSSPAQGAGKYPAKTPTRKP